MVFQLIWVIYTFYGPEIYEMYKKNWYGTEINKLYKKSVI